MNAQSEMLQKEIYLFEAIENFVQKQDAIKFVKCIVFLRPTEKNITYLIRELKHPRFLQYYISKYQGKINGSGFELRFSN